MAREVYLQMLRLRERMGKLQINLNFLSTAFTKSYAPRKNPFMNLLRERRILSFP